jgi:predicted dehydrogenase
MDVEDVAEIGLKFASGAIGGVHVNYVQRPPVHRLEIVGTNGTLRWDSADGILHVYEMPAEFGTWSADPPTAQIEQIRTPDGFDRNQLFIDQTKHFLDVIRGEQPVCNLQDGIEALRLALAAKESQKTRQAINF